MSQQAPYSYISFIQMRQQLAQRLYDPTETFWNDAELGQYCIEALRTWNALANYWREDFNFSPVPGTVWYDIPSLANTLRPYTVTDAQLYPVMEYHLLEPATGVNPWTGSLQFSAADFIAAVQRRRDEILSQTDCTLNVRLVPAVAGRITLSDTVIDVRRMAYLPNPPGVPFVLFPEDTWAEQSYNPRYLQTPAGAPGTPYAYLLSTQPPLSFDTDAPPSYAGNYELLTVEAGPALSASTPTTLLIPDDWTWVLKWGALADLLGRESVSGDPLRAQYCESRYQMGLKLMRSASALLSFRANNVPLQIDSVRDADLYNTTWQGQPPGPTTMAVHAGLNLVAMNPPGGELALVSMFADGLNGADQFPLSNPPWEADAFGEPLLQILNHFCCVEDASLFGEEAYRNGVTWPDDQWAAIDIHQMIGDSRQLSNLDIYFRVSPDFLSYYDAFIVANQDGTVTASLSSSAGVIGSVTVPFISGGTFLAGAIGTFIFCYYNGVLVASGTDSTQTNGFVAISSNCTSAVTDVQFSNFRGGSASLVTNPVTLTVVENAPVPSADNDPVQVSRGDLDAVIDYAQHLAAFKMGGAEFTDTLPLMARFFNQAKMYGLKLEEFAEYTDALYGLSQRENSMNPPSAPIPEDANA
jgi:hypothetical protein